MPWRAAAALLLPLLMASAATGDARAHAPALSRASGDSPPSASGRMGTIEGVIRIRQVPQRRVASRYAGARGGAARPVQEIPAVVYLAGTAGEPALPVTAPEMAQEDTVFVPSLVIVPVGSTVRFPNHDPFFHNVFSYSAASRFDLGRYPRGESKDVTFAEPGLVKVYCEVHESMRGAILVMENRHWARPDGDGRFRLEDVPPGRYTLVAWHADRGEKETPVTVPSSGLVRVEIEL